MFILHDFVFNTILHMVGHEPDYKVCQYALGWLDKGLLTSEDLQVLDETIRAQYPADHPTA